MYSSLIEAVESVVEAVDCCKLLCALESSSLLKLLNLLLKLLNLFLLKQLIVVSYYVL